MTISAPSAELDRLAALRRYNILDTASEEAFDDLTRLAAHICETPIALISLFDDHRQWFKSKVGVDADETPHELAFCAYTLEQADLFIVPDAQTDPRFNDNPVVTGTPHVRFYAGTPLINPQGHKLGTLCVLDQEPRQLTAKQIDMLRSLGRQVIAQLELRRHVAEMAHTVNELIEVEASLKLRDRAITAANNGIVITDLRLPDHPIISCNPAFERITGYTANDVIGRNCRFLQGPDTDQAALDKIRKAIREARTCRVVLKNYRADGVPFWNELAISPVQDGEGELTHFIGIQTDVTDREQAAALLHAVFEASVDGILSVDHQGKIVTFNRKFVEMWGIPAHLVAAGDDTQLITYVLNQLIDPQQFIGKVKELYAHPDAESYDLLNFADGRVFERYSQPQKVGNEIMGRVWSFRDISERKRAEEEHMRLQAEIIRVQAATLAQLSTPLIPISDQVMVMPLIGAIDQQRAQYILETLLQKLNVSPARVVVIDITGVPDVDTQVANILLQTARAVRLLGAQVVLTGMRPEVAQTLSGLSIDLRSMVTCSTLQRGIALVMDPRGD